MAPEPFFGIAANDRADALQVAAAQSGRPVHVLEKDVWVVWTFRALLLPRPEERVIMRKDLAPQP